MGNEPKPLKPSIVTADDDPLIVTPYQIKQKLSGSDCGPAVVSFFRYGGQNAVQQKDGLRDAGNPLLASDIQRQFEDMRREAQASSQSGGTGYEFMRRALNEYASVYQGDLYHFKTSEIEFHWLDDPTLMVDFLWLWLWGLLLGENGGKTLGRGVLVGVENGQGDLKSDSIDITGDVTPYNKHWVSFLGPQNLNLRYFDPFDHSVCAGPSEIHKDLLCKAIIRQARCEVALRGQMVARAMGKNFDDFYRKEVQGGNNPTFKVYAIHGMPGLNTRRIKVGTAVGAFEYDGQRHAEALEAREVSYFKDWAEAEDQAAKWADVGKEKKTDNSALVVEYPEGVFAAVRSGPLNLTGVKQQSKSPPINVLPDKGTFIEKHWSKIASIALLLKVRKRSKEKSTSGKWEGLGIQRIYPKEGKQKAMKTRRARGDSHRPPEH